MVLLVRLYLGLLVALASALSLSLAGTAAQQGTCADYTTSAAAQFALDINPSLAESLDPDGNGTACDHERAAGTGGPTSSGLQIPSEEPTSPAVSQIPAQATVDTIDQQPADTTTTTTQEQPSVLDGTLGSSRTAFEAMYGSPVEVIPDETIPEITGVVYAPPPTAFDLFAIYDTGEVAIIYIGTETTWDGAGVVDVLRPFLPSDIDELPQPEPLDDITYMMTLHSAEFEQQTVAALMDRSFIPGEVGDFYIVLYTEDGSGVFDIEIGLGNGDNVRSDFEPSTDQVNPPTATVASTGQTTLTTTVDASTFLANTRAEIDQLQAEIDEFRAIISAGTFTDPEIDRLSVIISNWVGSDTTLPAAPPQHSAMAQQLQQVRTDISSAGVIFVAWLGEPDTTDLTESGTLLDSVEMTLADLDRELTALGF